MFDSAPKVCKTQIVTASRLCTVLDMCLITTTTTTNNRASLFTAHHNDYTSTGAIPAPFFAHERSQSSPDAEGHAAHPINSTVIHALTQRPIMTKARAPKTSTITLLVSIALPLFFFLLTLYCNPKSPHEQLPQGTFVVIEQMSLILFFFLSLFFCFFLSFVLFP